MNKTRANTRRMFFALPVEIEDDGSLKPVNDILSKNAGTIKTVALKNYHITLKFLGPVDEGKCQEIIKAFETLPIDAAPIPYSLEGLGAFPDIKRAAVIWYGIRTDRNKVEDIQKKIEKMAGVYGFRDEKRPCTPHLTIARLKKNARITDELASFIKEHSTTPFGTSVFDTVVLFESSLTPQGPVYTPLMIREFQEVQAHDAPD